MKLLILLMLTYSVVVNGQTCDEATIDFQTNHMECYRTFTSVAEQALSGGLVNDNMTALLCENVTCRSAIMEYSATCQSNETVCEVDEVS